jgi:hypothetical protein
MNTESRIGEGEVLDGKAMGSPLAMDFAVEV